MTLERADISVINQGSMKKSDTGEMVLRGL